MPALMKSRLGSFSGTSGALGTTVWPRWRKKSRKPSRIWSPVTEPFRPAPSRSGNRRAPQPRGRRERPARRTEPAHANGTAQAIDPVRGRGSSFLLAQHLHRHLLRKPPRREESPRPPPVAQAAERAARPRDLGLPLARGLDRLGDERLGEPARRQVRLDAEPPRPACPERSRALVGEGRVADPAELAAAGDGGRGGLAPVAEGDEPRLEPSLGLGRTPEPARRHVERRRRRAAPAAARSGRP